MHEPVIDLSQISDVSDRELKAVGGNKLKSGRNERLTYLVTPRGTLMFLGGCLVAVVVHSNETRGKKSRYLAARARARSRSRSSSTGTAPA